MTKFCQIFLFFLVEKFSRFCKVCAQQLSLTFTHINIQRRRASSFQLTRQTLFQWQEERGREIVLCCQKTEIQPSFLLRLKDLEREALLQIQRRRRRQSSPSFSLCSGLIKTKITLPPGPKAAGSRHRTRAPDSLKPR